VSPKILNRAVVVGALGYFVDIYDLLLFAIVRVESLRSIGVPDDKILDVGVFLLNVQMGGLLLGGILWGILGDKKGRISVLFGSIALYSLANLANGFVHTVEAYAVLRLLAGIGLAGELGAAITLVSEVLPKETRGYGTAIVAGIGVCGAIFAGIAGDLFPWRTAFVIGGILGLVLLVLRINLLESKAFDSIKDRAIPKGDFRILFGSRERAWKYAACILIGVPIWFCVGILVTLSPEMSKAIGVTGPVSAGKAIMFCYGGLAIGDLSSGILSQWIGSRRKVVLAYILLSLAVTVFYLYVGGFSVAVFYWVCFAVGAATGYWAVFVTMSAEQFGTNIRATVTTTAPNFVRGSLVPVTLLFQALKPHIGLVHAAFSVGMLTFVMALFALSTLKETFHKDLDYIEG
jgi:MFS family permease